MNMNKMDTDGPYGLLWVLMGSYGSLWVLTGSYGFSNFQVKCDWELLLALRTLMCSYGFLRFLTGPYGLLRVLMGPLIFKLNVIGSFFWYRNWTLMELTGSNGILRVLMWTYGSLWEAPLCCCNPIWHLGEYNGEMTRVTCELCQWRIAQWPRMHLTWCI